MEIITSKQNPLIKTVRSLHEKKYRKELGLGFCEGIKMVNEAIKYGDFIDIIFTKKYEKDFEGTLVSEEVFKYISAQDTPDGILATFQVYGYGFNLADFKPNSNFLVLDGVSDPANLGTILRTASAFGYKELLLLNGCCDIYNPKVVSSSRGAIFKTNCYEIDLSDLKQSKTVNKNIKLVAADMNGINMFEYKRKEDTVYGLVLGNEANGISDDVLKLCDDIISIPMEEGNESLNVAISGAILMNEFRR